MVENLLRTMLLREIFLSDRVYVLYADVGNLLAEATKSGEGGTG